MKLRVSPATVTEPVRLEVVVLSATAKTTEPLPVPLAPEDIVTHDTLLVAVQLHPEVVVTVAVCEPLVAPCAIDVGVTVKSQAAPA